MAKKTSSRATKRSTGKGRKGRGATFSRFIFKVMKNVHLDMSISKNAMKIIDNFISDTFERVATEAANLKSIAKETTLQPRSVQSAVKLVLPG